MPFSRKAKRTRNTTSFDVGSDKHAEPEGAYQCNQTSCSPAKTNSRGYLLKTSAYTTSIATPAATDTSSQSIYWSNASAMEQTMCPVTGVYANILDDYCISPDIIGRGHYGIVRECIHQATRQSFAVKSIDKSKIGRLDHLRREIFLLANINHTSILKMVDCYEDERCVHIITEKYDGGELFDRIADSASPCGCFSERKAGAIIKSLLEAVAYLHDNEIVHRDIKPENILFESNDEDAAIKLVDFGLSCRHQKGDKPMTNPVGTAYYMSPELLGRSYDIATDVWSVGVVTYVLLCGFPPFNGISDGEIQDATRRGTLHFEGQKWSNKSYEAMDFVWCLLKKDPRQRLTAREALMHPWMRNI